MMTERQRRFREAYKADISPHYNGLVHVLVMYVVGIAALWYCVLNAYYGYVFFISMVAQYLIYEMFHNCCDVSDNWFVRSMPFINTIRRHHTAHHNQGIMMRYNMNLTFPIADWFLGTSDLRRGLLGHLFNGYSGRYVKEELKPLIARFKIDDC